MRDAAHIHRGFSLFGHDKAIVLFDGNCKLCRRTIRALRAADLLNLITCVNALDDESRLRVGVGHLDVDTLMREMHVVVGERAWSGFEACRVIASRIPILWPAWPFLYIWPIPLVGQRIYRQVADSRSCQTQNRAKP